MLVFVVGIEAVLRGEVRDSVLVQVAGHRGREAIPGPGELSSASSCEGRAAVRAFFRGEGLSDVDTMLRNCGTLFRDVALRGRRKTYTCTRLIPQAFDSTSAVRKCVYESLLCCVFLNVTL